MAPMASLPGRCCLAATSEYALPERYRTRRPMIGCDTAIFTDPDDYRMSVPGLRLRLVLTGQGEFEARRTWVHLHRLTLACCTETVPRVAFVVPAPGPVFVFSRCAMSRPSSGMGSRYGLARLWCMAAARPCISGPVALRAGD